MNIRIKEYKPSEDLKPYIEYFWTGKFNTNSIGILSQRVIPNGYIELIVHLSDLHCELFESTKFSSTPDYILIGLYSIPYKVNFKGTVNVFGIRFKPEGLHQVFGVPASELLENYADIESLSLRNLRDHCRKMREYDSVEEMINDTESFFRENLYGNKINLYYLNLATDLIRKTDGLVSVEELSSKVFISKRQLEREFKQKIGMSPKSYMKLARLNKVNRLIQTGKRVDLSDLSYICGYSDQAHFIRDFKKFTGEAPKMFLNNMDHFIVNPNKADLSF